MFNKFNTTIIFLVTLAAGLAVGLTIPVDFVRDQVVEIFDNSPSNSQADDSAATAAQSGAHTDHVELSETAQASMGLRLRSIELGDYRSKFEVPAFVREIPGASDLHISSRFEGLVKQVFVSEGQSVKPGDDICELELTGEQLATVQSDLLDAVQQASIIAKEIRRFEPLVNAGGVANKRLLEAKYEKERLDAKIETKSQELLVRGLSEEQVQTILDSKKLLRSITIQVPEDLIPPQLNAERFFESKPSSFVIEKLLFKPGAIAEHGANLCRLSYHVHLVLEGQAYEKDLFRLRQLIDEDAPITVTVGPDDNEEVLLDQRIAYLSNHADAVTNTFPFYVYLKNEKLFTDVGQSQENNYITWRWKPGQRAHIQIPDQEFTEKFVLPSEAVAVDGVNHFVFRWNGIVEHDHEEMEADHAHLEEFEAIEVAVIHKDRHSVVINPKNDKLKIADQIAINCATQLLFALRSGGGSGHSHSHEH